MMVERASASIVDATRRSRVDRLRSILTKVHLIGVARFADRTARRCAVAGVNVVRSFARVPLVGRGLDPLLARIDRRDRLHFDLAELLRVCGALNDQRLSFWIAGGWGLDALVGCETRRHGDLDLVLDRFRDDFASINTLVTGLGYQRKRPLGGTLWFPDAEVYEDSRGHRMEFLNVNWELLIGIDALLGPDQTLEHDTAGETNQARQFFLKHCTSTGALDGVSMPTLSVAAQQLFHLGYESRPVDVHAEDVSRLISMGQVSRIDSLDRATARSSTQETHQPSTLLLVPIFTLPSELWRLCRLYHNDLNLIPPHVTLAFPFLPLESVTEEVVQELSTLFSETVAFDFELGEIGWFGSDVVYLEPSNADVFISIVETLKKRFDDFHPYDDAFDSVIPHVTLSDQGSPADRRILERHAPKYLPISARASHVWMMSNDRGPEAWSIVKIFQLGTSSSAESSV
jgi:2'-5' RNA ligase